ncbi:hypothetical protein [Pontibaca salina]|uniref:Chaperone modulatory protein CbpM n=1 Tax=Pontibaca salina TaxID=2795731 RepID=A0A934M1Y7_9RHOB|nr:hypothetical protein [Pontibaca salina]MBI6628259.1 hypothetical protein [Pontibaca salina]
MTVLYSETQLVRTIDRLTESQLTTFIQAEIITPVQTDSGPAFREIDVARLNLLCELSDEFDLNEDALGMIMSLVDQLHSARRDLRNIVTALKRENTDVQRRIASALLHKHDN